MVSPANAVTLSTLQVAVFPSSLTPGTYTGAVTIGAGGGTQIIPVTLVVASTQAIAINPSSFTFTYIIGGVVPASQSTRSFVRSTPDGYEVTIAVDFAQFGRGKLVLQVT